LAASCFQGNRREKADRVLSGKSTDVLGKKNENKGEGEVFGNSVRMRGGVSGPIDAKNSDAYVGEGGLIQRCNNGVVHNKSIRKEFDKVSRITTTTDNGGGGGGQKGYRFCRKNP